MPVTPLYHNVYAGGRVFCMDDDTPKGRQKVVAVRLNAKGVAALDTMRQAEGMTRGAFLRELLKDAWLDWEDRAND